MTTDEALERLENEVQECREDGDTDLRIIIGLIQKLRQELKEESSKGTEP